MHDELLRDLEAAPTTSVSVIAFASRLRETQAKLDEAKAKVKAIQATYDDLRKRQLPDAMAELGLSSFKLDTGETIYTRTEVHVGCPADRRPELLDWLTEHGHGGLITQSVHPKTLDAFYREQDEAGAELPSFLSVYKETTAVLKKS